MNILEKHLTLVVAAKEMDDVPPPKNFIVVALDMLDAVCGALERSFEAFMAADRAKLMQMVLYCIQVWRVALVGIHWLSDHCCVFGAFAGYEQRCSTVKFCTVR